LIPGLVFNNSVGCATSFAEQITQFLGNLSLCI
jgi:hypothetical protein